MTGMYNDGVEGIKMIKQRGGQVIAQDEATSVIFGMNKLAIHAGFADHIVSLEKIVPKILELIN
jgi:two-component system chemotaxis response regulator CheB